jgi:hypothetical protein
VLRNDFFGDGYSGAKLITGVTDPGFGTIRIAEDGKSLIYTPEIGFVGRDTVTYVVDSSQLISNSAPVSGTNAGGATDSTIRRIQQSIATVAIHVDSLLNRDSYSISFIPGQTIELPVLSNDNGLEFDSQIGFSMNRLLIHHFTNGKFSRTIP